MKRASIAGEDKDIASQGNKSEVGGNLSKKNAIINSLEKNKTFAPKRKPAGGVRRKTHPLNITFNYQPASAPNHMNQPPAELSKQCLSCPIINIMLNSHTKSNAMENVPSTEITSPKIEWRIEIAVN